MHAIETTRFGRLEMEKSRIIHFPNGLLGFPANKDFIILEHKPDSPFCWLQSVESPSLAFVLTNPFLVQADYLEGLSPTEKMIFGQGEKGSQKIVFALVTIPRGEPEKMTVNLLGPLVIDIVTKTGSQVILADSGYSHRHPFTFRHQHA
jgi:flagellar assembly factor FliW